MSEHRKMSPQGLQLLIEREGRRNHAYPDPGTGGAPWTIGVGHTGPEVHPGLYWDDAQIEWALTHDLLKFEVAVGEAVSVPLEPHMRDALISFAFNVGTGAFAGSTLVKKLNAGDYAGASAEFRKWNLPSVVIGRRAGEWAQFNGEPVARSAFDARHP